MVFQADVATGIAEMDSCARIRRALEFALTDRGNPVAEVERAS
jgi:hypothetical protein